MLKRQLLITAMIFLIRPIFPDCVEMRKTSKDEQNYAGQMVSKFKTALPFDRTGWAVKRETSYDAPNFVCTSNGYGPVTGGYTVQLKRVEGARERRKAFSDAYRNGSKLTPEEKEKIASLEKEKQLLKAKFKKNRSMGGKTDPAKVKRYSDAMQKAAMSGNQKEFNRIQEEYAAYLKGGMSSEGDSDLSKMDKIQSEIDAIKIAKHKKGLEAAKEFAGDLKLEISIKMNSLYEFTKNTRRNLNVNGARFAYMTVPVEDKYESDREVVAFVFFGHWKSKKDGSGYDVSLESDQSNQAHVRGVLVKLKGHEERVEQLVKTLPWSNVASLVH